MKKSLFNFNLPQELIAQTPIEPRDHSRLLKLNKETGEVSHHHFYDIIDFLKEGDLLVVNDSRVIPARLYGNKKNTGAGIEFLLLERKEKDVWEILVKPGKKALKGAEFEFGNGLLTAEIIEVKPDGNRLARFKCEEDIFVVLEKIGQMPLPHYITEELKDRERYQTVYSRELGSAAAPTAGLHFTKELMEKIKTKGVKIAYVTLHVGLGTFRPVKADNVEEHHMHSEHYEMSDETAKLINETKKNGGRVIAVGTTSCRTIESVAQKEGPIKASEGYTDIFIYPGYEFKVLDGIITNFHLPESTLIMLISAFAGRENILNAYNIAVENKYRFYSFGDSMAII